MAYISDGYQTLIAFSLIPGIAIKEIEVQPPGLDSNGEIDTTTMRNTRWRTKQPKHLITATEINAKVQIDSIIYSNLAANIGQNGTITVTLPDSHTITVWGWLDKVVPESWKEGEFAKADMKVHISNQDNSGNEVAPVYA